MREALIQVARVRWAKAVDSRNSQEAKLPRSEAVALDSLYANRKIELGAAIGRYVDRMMGTAQATLNAD